MTNCPQCQRKLLSLASARCNWCGHTIADTNYQQKAQEEREAHFQHLEERDELARARLSISRMNEQQKRNGAPFGLPSQNGRDRRQQPDLPPHSGEPGRTADRPADDAGTSSAKSAAGQNEEEPARTSEQAVCQRFSKIDLH